MNDRSNNNNNMKRKKPPQDHSNNDNDDDNPNRPSSPLLNNENETALESPPVIVDSSSSTTTNNEEHHNRTAAAAASMTTQDDVVLSMAQEEEEPPLLSPPSSLFATTSSRSNDTAPQQPLRLPSPPAAPEQPQQQQDKDSHNRQGGYNILDRLVTSRFHPRGERPRRQMIYPKKVSFGTVHVQHFERCLGKSVIPTGKSFSYPLGMAMQAMDDNDNNNNDDGARGVTVLVDEYEAEKQQRLRQRWNEHYNPSSTASATSSTSATPSSSLAGLTALFDPKPPDELETRGDSTIFCKLIPAKQRKQLLFPPIEEEEGTLSNHEPEETKQEPEEDSGASAIPQRITRSRSKALSAAASAAPQRQASLLEQENTQNASDETSTTATATTTASGVTAKKKKKKTLHAMSPETKDEVNQLHKELKMLRDSVQKDPKGCSCQKIRAESMTKRSEIQQALQVRRRLPENHQDMTDLALRNVLLEVTKGEDCCDFDTCPCMQNWISCIAGICSCVPERATDVPPGITEAIYHCGNWLYQSRDAQAIDAYRQKHVTKPKWVDPNALNCVVIQEPDDSDAMLNAIIEMSIDDLQNGGGGTGVGRRSKEDVIYGDLDAVDLGKDEIEEEEEEEKVEEEEEEEEDSKPAAI